jgi:biopolymer transport protein ExbD
MGYGRRRYQRVERNQTFGLNITSMTDMFTILLVFLLQTYSTADFQVDPERGISLPLSNVSTNPTKALKVSLSKTELKIEGRTIASLTPEGDFAKTDLEGSDTNFIKPLFAELEKVSKESQEPSVKDGKILFQADSSLNYAVLRKVMYTASMAGFPKLKMATVVGD